MRKVIYSALIFLFIIGVIWIGLLVSDIMRPGEEIPTPDNPFPLATDYPATPNQNGEIPVSTADGRGMNVADFTKSPNTIPAGGGLYLIATESQSQPGYDVYYYDKDGSFSISLLRNPLGLMRKQAEQKLLQALSITAPEACNLRVNVAVPADVSEFYSGKANLGLSFCPGSTPLSDQ